jgi:hypothetical protein
MRDRDDLTFDDVIPTVKGQAGDIVFSECMWFSTYRIHHRCASRLRAGRCFLLGDAAHVHSPVGAQGMNTGLQDACNLAWKLACVARGEADAALLDSYQTERMPVAERLLATTDRAFSMIVSDSWIAKLIRARVVARVAATLLKRRRFQRFVFRTVSQIGIAYHDSPLSKNDKDVTDDMPRAGDRFPWVRLSFGKDGAVEDLFQKIDDRRFTLLVVGQRAPLTVPGFEGALNILTVSDNPENRHELERAMIPRPSFYLIRPDGYVGLAGKHLNLTTLADYARDVLGLAVKQPHPVPDPVRA